MGHLIDTSALVDVERTSPGALAAFLSGLGDDVAISTITAAELLTGAHRGARAEQRAARERFAERVVATVPALAVDLVVARVHARLWADLAERGIVPAKKKRGRSTLDAHDVLIAATALAHDRELVASDADFRLVPGLRFTRVPKGAAPEDA